ncbi:MAG: histidine phosphatase family protein [Gemmatimonas sp.]|uniref:SixA phosphatase family protein n=1 Tax=Gemmatimonas sp. TaxID=1962908 RepID=UPI0031C3851F|nr:histidine phosphatase family protein [Gemmatimonas sp.]
MSHRYLLRLRSTVLLCGAVVAALASSPSLSGAQPSLVILVRHGEKQPAPLDDPSLSEAGVARAKALDAALAHSTPSTIVVSTRKRTVETAAVVQARTGVAPTVIALDGQHVRTVAAAVMQAKGVVLVVGHSNTISAIVNALAGTKLPDICDASYATMFVVTPAVGGSAAQVVQSSYGAPDAVGAASCGGMVPK